MIERYEGLTDTGITVIDNYLQTSGYSQMGHCPAGWIGAKNLEGIVNGFEWVNDTGSNYYYCINKVTGYHTLYPQRSYYRVKLFFKFELPVLGQISTFDVDGQTSEIDYTYDNDIIYKQI